MANCIVCGKSETSPSSSYGMCKATVNSFKTGAMGGFTVFPSLHSSQVHGGEYHALDINEILPRMPRLSGDGLFVQRRAQGGDVRRG